MSERLLKAFQQEAEHVTRAPAFELIEQRGRRRRRRRQAAVGGMLACALALAVTTTVALRDDGPRAGEPATPSETSQTSAEATPYPGNRMTTLEEGTYDLNPTYSSAGPYVRVRLPEGWNAWESPNRFEGVGAAPGTFNEDALGPAKWYMGLSALEVEDVAAPRCAMADVTGDAAALAEALTEVPWFAVTSGPDTVTRSGYTAYHLRLRQTRAAPGCHEDRLFGAVGQRNAGGGDPSATFDAWVVDVDGKSVLVWSGWTRTTPPAEVQGLLEIIDSMEIVVEEP